MKRWRIKILIFRDFDDSADEESVLDWVAENIPLSGDFVVEVEERP